MANKYKALITVCTVLLFFTPLAAQENSGAVSNQDSVQTEVSMKAVFSQLWRKSKRSRLFKCWGGPEEVLAFQEELSESSKQDSGSYGKSFDGKTNGKNFDVYTPQTTTWSSAISEDRIFSLSFSQKVTLEQEHFKRSTCSTEKFYTKLEAIANTFRSSASLFVPDDVYLVRVRRLKYNWDSKTVHALVATIKNGRTMVEDASTFDLDLETIKVGEFDYFFVRPGERMDFQVQWQSQALEDASFEVDYEVRLMGQDMCNQVLWDSTKASTPNALELVRSKFSKEQLSTNPHDAIAALACFRSKSYLSATMRGNHGSTLVEALKFINSQFEAFSQEALNAEPFYREIWTSLQMTMYDVSRTVLSDLYSFCETRTVLGLFPGAPAEPLTIRGYHYASRHYYKIRLLLEQAPVDFLEVFANTLSRFAERKKSYAEISTPENIAVLEELQYSIFGSSFQTVDLVSDLLKDLPQTLTGQTASDLGQWQIQQGRKIFDQLDIAFRNQLEKIAQRSPEIISPYLFGKAVQAYKESLVQTRVTLASDIAWFTMDSDLNIMSMPFAQDMMTLNLELMAVSGSLLQTVHGSKLGVFAKNDFLKMDEMNQLYNNVDQCLRTAR